MTNYSEREMYVPALIAMASQPNGEISTSDLIAELEHTMKPSGDDLRILDGRHDTHFSQKVRNIKSHKESPGNIVAEGLAEDVPRGFRITDRGRKFLKAKGHPA